VTNDCFELHKEDGTEHVFMPSKQRLLVLVTTVENKIN